MDFCCPSSFKQWVNDTGPHAEKCKECLAKEEEATRIG